MSTDSITKVPVHRAGTLGQQQLVSRVSGWILSRTEHRGGFVTTDHAHERASLNIVLGGLYCESVRGTSRQFLPGAVIVKPAGESHANVFREHGARCFLIEVDTPDCGVGSAPNSVFDSYWTAELGGVGPLTIRLLREMSTVDSFSELATEALALELVDALGERRRSFEIPSDPTWMPRAIELLQETTGPVTLAKVAHEVQREPTHVARVFRRVFGESIGEQARRLRLERAATAIMRSNQSLSAIALDAGYYDQSHFVREFRRRYAMTPSAFRRGLNGG
jgi:AraC family transcriptional regulator